MGTVVWPGASGHRRHLRSAQPPPSFGRPRSPRPPWRLPLPARCDHAGRALLPALRAVVSRRGGAAGEGRNLRGPCHRLPLVQRFTPLLAEAAPPTATPSVTAGTSTRLTSRSAVRGDTCTWRSTMFGHVSDVLLAAQRYGGAARRFFASALATSHVAPVEVVTDKAPSSVGLIDELLPGAFHNVRAARQQPHRGRPRPAQGAPPADARPRVPPDDGGDGGRLRPDPPPGSLRTRCRRARDTPHRCGLCRAGPVGCGLRRRGRAQNAPGVPTSVSEG